MNERGQTLLETLTVLGLMFGGLGWGIPALQAYFQETQLRSAAMVFQADFRRARSRRSEATSRRRSASSRTATASGTTVCTSTGTTTVSEAATSIAGSMLGWRAPIGSARAPRASGSGSARVSPRSHPREARWIPKTRSASDAPTWCPSRRWERLRRALSISPGSAFRVPFESPAPRPAFAHWCGGGQVGAPGECLPGSGPSPARRRTQRDRRARATSRAAHRSGGR